MRVDGQRWSRPLYFVSKHHGLLYKKPSEEGFVPDDLDEALSTLHPKCSTGKDYGGEFLYTLNDTFIVDFNKNELFFTVITECGMEVIKLSVEKCLKRNNPCIGNK